MKKPQNHVTRGLASKLEHTGTPFPDLTQAQVDWIKANIPPKCYDHRSEVIEDHLKYAGKVAWGLELINQWEERLSVDAIDADAEVAHQQ